MSPLPPALLEQIATAAAAIPQPLALAVAGALRQVPANDWGARRRAAIQVLAQAPAAAVIGTLLDSWQRAAPTATATEVAAALEAAAIAIGRERQRQTTELVWTGPSSGLPLRKTRQALIEVIQAAQRELLIVAFVVYDIDDVAAALRAATARGVAITLVIETVERHGRPAFDRRRALGDQAAQHWIFYEWPLVKRPLEGQQHGLLHAKFAVADRQVLLVSSANLTQHALDRNMELGVLIRGGPTPGTAVDHVRELIAQRTLVRL
ncbi:MAG TPA: DISARM system phospholipase D-like protein DrmC [Herpetosiphonaceae bacterium]